MSLLRAGAMSWAFDVVRRETKESVMDDLLGMIRSLAESSLPEAAAGNARRLTAAALGSRSLLACDLAMGSDMLLQAAADRHAQDQPQESVEALVRTVADMAKAGASFRADALAAFLEAPTELSETLAAHLERVVACAVSFHGGNERQWECLMRWLMHRETLAVRVRAAWLVRILEQDSPGGALARSSASTSLPLLETLLGLCIREVSAVSAETRHIWCRIVLVLSLARYDQRLRRVADDVGESSLPTQWRGFVQSTIPGLVAANDECDALFVCCRAMLAAWVSGESVALVKASLARLGVA